MRDLISPCYKPVKSLHAGLDFVLHFTHMDVEAHHHRGGFKQGSMDEFALTYDDEIGLLERLRASDVPDFGGRTVREQVNRHPRSGDDCQRGMKTLC